jgi:hypothetical protein
MWTSQKWSKVSHITVQSKKNEIFLIIKNRKLVKVGSFLN